MGGVAYIRTNKTTITLTIFLMKKIIYAALCALMLGAVPSWAQWGPRTIPEPTDGLTQREPCLKGRKANIFPNKTPPQPQV